jgi:hypothetical protein
MYSHARLKSSPMDPVQIRAVSIGDATLTLYVQNHMHTALTPTSMHVFNAVLKKHLVTDTMCVQVQIGATCVIQPRY